MLPFQNQAQFAESANLQSASTGQAVQPQRTPGGMAPTPQSPTMPTGTTPSPTIPQIKARQTVPMIQKGPPRGLGSSPLFSRSASFRTRKHTEPEAVEPNDRDAVNSPMSEDQSTPSKVPSRPARRYTMTEEERRKSPNTGDAFLPSVVRDSWHKKNPSSSLSQTKSAPKTGPVMRERSGGGQISEDGTIVVGGNQRRYSQLF